MGDSEDGERLAARRQDQYGSRVIKPTRSRRPDAGQVLLAAVLAAAGVVAVIAVFGR